MLINAKVFNNLLSKNEKSIDPFDGQIHDIVFGLGNEWVGFVFGTLFLLLGVAMLFMYHKTKRIAEEYKVKQLEVWKKNNPKSRLTRYENTGLYLPMFERVKSSWPLILGPLFIIIGLTWIIGNSLTAL